MPNLAPLAVFHLRVTDRAVRCAHPDWWKASRTNCVSSSDWEIRSVEPLLRASPANPGSLQQSGEIIESWYAQRELQRERELAR